jgi:hypothetical protein
MGMHGHGFCCEKGKKGKFMYCLVLNQGLYTWNTYPLLVILFRSENIVKNKGGYDKRHAFWTSVATYLTTLLYYPHCHINDVTIKNLCTFSSIHLANMYFLVSSSPMSHLLLGLI